MIRPDSLFPPRARLPLSPDPDGAVRSRFVTQSHALGAPPATPQGVLLAVAVAVAVYLIGRRLSA